MRRKWTLSRCGRDMERLQLLKQKRCCQTCSSCCCSAQCSRLQRA